MARREQNTSQGFKNTSQGFKNTSQNPKTLLRIQKHFPESKILPRIQKHFPESKHVLDSGKYFGFFDVFLVFGTCFGFLDVFWILGSVLERFVPMSHGTEVSTYSHNMTLSPKNTDRASAPGLDTHIKKNRLNAFSGNSRFFS